VEGSSILYTKPQTNKAKHNNTTRLNWFILANTSLIKDWNEEMLSVIA